MLRQGLDLGYGLANGLCLLLGALVLVQCTVLPEVKDAPLGSPIPEQSVPPDTCEFLAAHFNKATKLDLPSMKFGDADMIKLAAALEYCHANGALPLLTSLQLFNNQIGDAGMQSLSAAVARGA